MLGLGIKHTTNTYCEINNTSQHEMIKTNVGDLKSKSSIDKIATDNHCLQNTYWLSKINKTAIKARFIVIYRKSSIKPLAKAITSTFQLFYKQIYCRSQYHLGRTI